MSAKEGKMLRLNALSKLGNKTACVYIIPNSLIISKQAGNLRKRPRKRRGFKFLADQTFVTQLCEWHDKI